MPAPARRTGTDARTALGVGVTPLETRRDVVLHVAVRAEQLGYDAFYLAEGWGHDASVLLAEVAVRTSRIRLGTGVLNVWGRSPATIAMLATSLHQVSDGRFTLGLGAGSPQLAEGLHDTLFTAPVARPRTVVQQVRRLLDGERLAPSFPGEHRALRLATDPAPQIPIHLAALGPAATRLAGELADGWCPFLLPCSALGDRIRILEQGTAANLQGRALPQSAPPSPLPSPPTTTTADGSPRGGWRFTSPAWARSTDRRSGTSASNLPSTTSSPPTPRTAPRRSHAPLTYCSTSSPSGETPHPHVNVSTAGLQRERDCPS